MVSTSGCSRTLSCKAPTKTELEKGLRSGSLSSIEIAPNKSFDFVSVPERARPELLPIWAKTYSTGFTPCSASSSFATSSTARCISCIMARVSSLCAEDTIAKFPLTEDCSGALKNLHCTSFVMTITTCDARRATAPAKTTYLADITAAITRRKIVSRIHSKPAFTVRLGMSYQWSLTLCFRECAI